MRRKLWNCYPTRPCLLFIDNIEEGEDHEHILPERSNDLPLGRYVIVAPRNLEIYDKLPLMWQHPVWYDVKELDDESAQTSYCKHEFGSRFHRNYQLEYRLWKDTRKVLETCCRLPLALNVVGAALASDGHTSHSSDWPCALKRLQNWLPLNGTKNDILKKSLEFSYNQLHESTKQVFLDIVFCLNESRLNELRVMYGDMLDILKPRALITEELQVEFRRSLRIDNSNFKGSRSFCGAVGKGG